MAAESTTTQASDGMDDRVSGRRSMVEEAYAILKDRILMIELPPGYTALEEQLAADLGMSRTPVREAAVRLAQEGLIEIVPRRGIRVKPVTQRDIREINEVLACLEVQAAERLAGRRPTSEEMKPLDDAIRGMDEALRAEDMAAWAKADYRFHRLLIELCGNRHLAETATKLLDRANRARLLTMPYRAKPVYSNSNHAAVVEAIRRGDAETAGEIHRAHKKRWTRGLNQLLERMDLPSGDDRG